MSYFTKEQYFFKNENATRRSIKNESIAIKNGMTEEQAELVSKLCSLRHEFHCNIEKTADSAENGLLNKIADLSDSINESGLPNITFRHRDIAMIDDMESLSEYADDMPKNHDSKEYEKWYDSNKLRIIGELNDINEDIEIYLSVIDKKYHTSFCPIGISRLS